MHVRVQSEYGKKFGHFSHSDKYAADRPQKLTPTKYQRPFQCFDKLHQIEFRLFGMKWCFFNNLKHFTFDSFIVANFKILVLL